MFLVLAGRPGPLFILSVNGCGLGDLDFALDFAFGIPSGSSVSLLVPFRVSDISLGNLTGLTPNGVGCDDEDDEG